MKCQESCQDFCRFIQSMPYHQGFDIKKSKLRNLPPCFKKTLLGEMIDGAYEQFRGPYGAHVHEFQDRWVIHKDYVDADEDPIGHLIHDAPEYLGSIAASLLVATLLGMRGRKNRRPEDVLAGGMAGVMALLAGKFYKMIVEEASQLNRNKT